MSYPRHELTIDADILAFQKEVSEKTAISSRPLRTSAYMWTRFLYRLIPSEKHTKPAPSNFAKFNDGLGESGVTLAEAMTGIRQFIRGADTGEEVK